MHRQASAAQSTLDQAHGTSSKMRSYFYPWERLTTERPNTIRLARCRMSSQAFSHRGKDLAMQRNFGLKPRRLTARPEGTAACGGLKPDSVREGDTVPAHFGPLRPLRPPCSLWGNH